MEIGDARASEKGARRPHLRPRHSIGDQGSIYLSDGRKRAALDIDRPVVTEVGVCGEEGGHARAARLRKVTDQRASSSGAMLCSQSCRASPVR